MATPLVLAIDARQAQKGAEDFKKATQDVQKSAQGISKDTKQAKKDIDDVGGAATESGKKVEEGAKKSAKAMLGFRDAADSVKRAIINTFAVIGTAQFIRGAIRNIADLEQTLGEVRGVAIDSRLPLQQQKLQYEELAAAARTMGVETRFSANESAKSLLLLSKAGLDVRQSIDSARNTLNLAAASGLDLERATDIMIATMSQFGIEARNSSRAVDTLIKTANETIINVDQLAESLKVVGPIANAIGIPLEDTAAAIGILGNAGINASAAGTQFRSILVNLVSPVEKARDRLHKMGLTLKDVDPQKVGLIGSLKALAAAEFQTADAVAIADRRNSAAAITLVRNIDALEKLKQANIEARGEGERLSVFMNDNLNVAFKRLNQTFQEAEFQTADSGFLKFLRNCVDSFTLLIRSVLGFDDAMEILELRFVNVKREVNITLEAIRYGFDLLLTVGKHAWNQLAETAIMAFNKIEKVSGQALSKIADGVSLISESLGSSIETAAQTLIKDAAARDQELKENQKTLDELIKEDKLQHQTRLANIEAQATDEMIALKKGFDALREQRKKEAEKRREEAGIPLTQPPATPKDILDAAIAENRGEHELGFDPTEEAGRHLQEVLEKMELEATLVGLSTKERERRLAIFEIERLARRAEVEDIDRVTEAYMKNFEVVQKGRHQKDFEDNIKEDVEKMREEEELLGLTNDERERSIILREIEREARKHEIEDIGKLIKELEAQLKVLQRYKEIKRVADEIGGAFRDAITDLGADISTLAEALDDVKNLFKSLQKTIFDALVSKPLSESISGFIQSLGKGFVDRFGIGASNSIGSPASNTGVSATVDTASGYAFEDRGALHIGGMHHIKTLDRGGMVLHQPALFASMLGGSQVAEKRSEAVLPLGRNAHGELGVKITGGARGRRQNIVNMTVVTKDSDSFRRSKRQIAAAVAREVSR